MDNPHLPTAYAERIAALEAPKWETVFATSTTERDGQVKVIIEGLTGDEKHPDTKRIGFAFFYDPARQDGIYRFHRGMRAALRRLDKLGIA